MNLMKLYKTVLLCSLLLGAPALKAQETENNVAQQLRADSASRNRIITRATMYGVGFTNVFDTYLSPQEYKGIDFRISRESMRMTRLMGRQRVPAELSSRQTWDIRTTKWTTTTHSPDWQIGTTACIIISQSRAISSCLPEEWETSTAALSTTCATVTTPLPSTCLHQSCSIWNGYLGAAHQEPSHHSTLPGEPSFGRHHVHAELWTVLLRNIHAGTLGRSSELHLPAQPALSETNADSRFPGRTRPDAPCLYMGCATV